MLTEERHTRIMEALNRQKSIGISELCELLDTSESTIRRDLITLDEAGLLTRVRGGAMAAGESFSAVEHNVAEKMSLYVEEKTAIARYAASLIEDGDFVFLDAGTTTEKMIRYIPSKSVTFVTNAFVSAKELAARGFEVLITAGEVKASTEAIVGAGAVLTLSRYNFTKCFMGTNGISIHGGFSTPDKSEADVKETAILRSREAFVLADSSKFGKVAANMFSDLTKAKIITDKVTNKKFFAKADIREVL